MSHEENPFESEQVAAEWINSVENEQGMIRDKEIYPLLESWISKIRPQLIVEIGSGQGICSDNIELGQGKYIGVEPSRALVERAHELYEDGERDFVVGNAYELPLPNEIADAGFSVNVWFHLENIGQASKELARVLKADGKFLIITANPSQNDIWESFYFDRRKDGKKIVGKVNVPINPMSKNTFYQHTLDEIKEALVKSGLEIDEVRELGDYGEGEKIFVAISGHKS